METRLGRRHPQRLPQRASAWSAHRHSVGGRLSTVARAVHSVYPITHSQGETHMAGTRTTTITDEPMTGMSAREDESTHPLAEAGQQATEGAGHLATRAVDLGLKQADRGRQHSPHHH